MISKKDSLTPPQQRMTGQDALKVNGQNLNFDSFQKLLLSAPLCPTPPETPFEGTAIYEPVILEDEPLEICELPQNSLTIKCPSFLNIFIVSTIFGRSKGSKELCDGSKDSVKLVNMDCLEYDDNLATVTKNCRGKSSCTVYSDAGIARNWTGRSECLDTEFRRKNEFRVKYRCVECDYWPDTVATQSCVRDNLILNLWETEESIADLSEADLTGLLKEYLNKFLNGAAHNMVDLNFREILGPDSSLCGMASMYRLLVNSFLTKSQLTQYDYSMMKNYLINVI